MNHIPSIRFIFVSIAIVAITMALAAGLILPLHSSFFRPYFDINSPIVGFLLFLPTVAFGIFTAKIMANLFIFDKGDKSDLQQVGGVRIGNFLGSVLTGKAISWPFAKLSATRESLRIQTPWGDKAWKKAELGPIQKTSTWGWKISESSSNPQFFIFQTMPWAEDSVDSKLRELGYIVE